MDAWQVKLFECNNDAPPDTKPRRLKPISVRAKNCDHALRAARERLRKNGHDVRSVNITNNRRELVAYVWKRPRYPEART